MLNVRTVLLAIVAALSATYAFAQDTGDTGEVTPANPGFMVLVDQLDEAADGDYYCADVWGSTVEVTDAMQMHTCKFRFREPEDQTWTTDSPSFGNISNTVGGYCAGSRTIEPGAQIHMGTCNTRSTGQQWVSDSSGMVHPASDTSLCWAVEKGVHGKCGNPDCTNYKRKLTLETCADVDSKYLIWTIPGGSVGL